MRACNLFLSATLVATLASSAFAQPKGGALAPPLYLPPPVSNPQGLYATPRPLGHHVAPYGVSGYVPFGDRTGYPGNPYTTYRGSYATPIVVPPIVLETPPNLTIRPGKLPPIDVLFPGVPPMALPRVPRMQDPTPPGPVVPVGEKN